MAVTSQLSADLSLGGMKVSDLKNAGLLKPSIIKPVIITIEKSLIIKKLGQLNDLDC